MLITRLSKRVALSCSRLTMKRLMKAFLKLKCKFQRNKSSCLPRKLILGTPWCCALGHLGCFPLSLSVRLKVSKFKKTPTMRHCWFRRSRTRTVIRRQNKATSKTSVSSKMKMKTITAQFKRTRMISAALTHRHFSKTRSKSSSECQETISSLVWSLVSQLTHLKWFLLATEKLWQVGVFKFSGKNKARW